jgi:hypothetical protein
LLEQSIPSSKIDEGTFGLGNWSSSNQVAGPTAGEFPCITIANPATSTQLLEVTFYLNAFLNGHRLFIGAGAPIPGAPFFCNWLDTRITGPAPTGISGTTPVVAPTGQVFAIAISPSVFPWAFPTIVLSPGFSAWIQGTVANTTESGYVVGRSREGDSSEYGPFGL